jgi:hypothetical protein
VADLTQTQRCRDATSLSEAQVLLEARGDRVRVSLSPARSQAADPLRTRVRVRTQIFRLPLGPSPPPCRQSSSCPS